MLDSNNNNNNVVFELIVQLYNYGIRDRRI